MRSGLKEILHGKGGGAFLEPVHTLGLYRQKGTHMDSWVVKKGGGRGGGHTTVVAHTPVPSHVNRT